MPGRPLAGAPCPAGSLDSAESPPVLAIAALVVPNGRACYAAPMTQTALFSVEILDQTDALNHDIWSQSPSVQASIQPVESFMAPGAIGAQQGMFGTPPAGFAVFDLCRVSFVRRGAGQETRVDESGDRVVRDGAAVYEQYVESPKPSEWLWRRLTEGRPFGCWRWGPSRSTGCSGCLRGRI